MRFGLGVFLTPLPRRLPWEVARQAVTLDHLSHGRLIFGAALGHSPADFVPFGQEWDVKIRAQKLDESLDILAGLWSGEPFGFEGRHYRMDEVRFQPTPIQSHLPVWVAAGWPRRTPLRRAARWDGAYLMTYHQDRQELLTPDDVAEVARFLAGDGGRQAPLEIGVNATLTGDVSHDRESVNAFEAAGATWWMELDDGGPEAYLRRIRRGPHPRV
jgi:alkanesulfonate monooxygenase SsuD/methylene tetrahydromethanopterin reductase-like flavin-dependent oxidoreductase (luciferase family)